MRSKYKEEIHRPGATVDSRAARGGRTVIDSDFVATLLAAVGISTVIVVDDEFEPKVENLIAVNESGIFSELDVDELSRIDFSAEREIWEGQLRTCWASLRNDQRRRIYEEVQRKNPGVRNLGEELSLLHDLLNSVRFISITPSEWMAEQSSLLVESSPDTVLILFDKHLGGGRREDGIDFIRNLYSVHKRGSIWTGLLTNRVRADEEYSAWEEMSVRLGEYANRLIVLSKDRLTIDSSSFIEGLRVLLMAHPAGELQQNVAESCRLVADEVLASIQNELNPLEFERIIFGLARDEGIWEVDMILRLLDIRRRMKVRLSLHDNDDVRKAILLLRELDSLRVGEINSGSVHAQRIYQDEIYDEGGHLARLYLPVELGDVFVKEHNNKQFVLVVQPCDLMVRSTGKRHPDLSFVTLLPIMGYDAERDVRPARTPGTLFELPAFWENGSSGWVELNRPAVVPIEAVDYCVLNSEGRSVAPLEEEQTEWLLPGWQKRGRRLRERAERLRRDYEGLRHLEKAARVKAALGIRKSCVTKPLIEGDNFSLGLRRVRRVLPPYARALLTSYCLHVARDAFERPLPADNRAD